MTTISTSKGEIIIRIATPVDAASLFQLRLHALTMNPEAFAADADKTATDGVEPWVKRISEYAQTDSGVIMVACAGLELVGMTGIVRGYSQKTRHSAMVWGVYVSPAWRRLHLAEAIINECMLWSRNHGIVVLKLGVLTINEPAIQCYLQCGFSIYGTEPRSNFVNEVYYDEYLMARLI